MNDEDILDHESDDSAAQRDAELDAWEDLDTWLDLLCGEYGQA